MLLKFLDVFRTYAEIGATRLIVDRCLHLLSILLLVVVICNTFYEF